MSNEERFVRNAHNLGKLEFSKHAYDKMRTLRISVSQVINCIENGVLVERQNGYDGEDPRMVFYNGHEHSFYVVATVTFPDSVVVTVCQTDFAKWKKEGEGIRRIS